MNLVFISPNFPLYYFNFCDRLKQRGVNVLGIGDQPYETLPAECINSCTEYYKVSSLENFDEVYRAVGYFTHKYGKIDWIESENEYWLETEATLRTEFNVNTGTKIENMSSMKYKSKMKAVYESVGVPVARYLLVDGYEEAKAFAHEVQYPVVVKPDNGVGASSTYKLKSDADLDYFFATKDPHVQFIMEEFVTGHVETFDGVTDADKNILVCTSHVMLNSIMDNVNDASDTAFYSQPISVVPDMYEVGSRCVKAFDTRSRFYHFEFFRLDQDKEGLGKKGDIVGLEVNMRAPGAYMPDMINYAYDIDVYSVWADMIAFNELRTNIERKYWVGYAGKRDGIAYAHSNEEVQAKYGDKVVLSTPVPEALAAAMGNHVFLFRTTTKEELFEMIRFILERADGTQWM